MIGTRGSVPAPAPGMQSSSLITMPVSAHSVKPTIFAELIEAATEQHYDAAEQCYELARPDFLAALRAVALDRRGNLSAEPLGYWLRNQQGRVAGEWKLVRGGPEKRRVWSRKGRDGRDGRDVSLHAREKSDGFSNAYGERGNHPSHPFHLSLDPGDDEGAL